MTDRHDAKNWLERPGTIRQLWWALGIVLGTNILLQLVIDTKGQFPIESWFGFAALFGFLSCFLMVVVAKLLGLVVKRPEDYYNVDHEEPAERSGENTSGT